MTDARANVCVKCELPWLVCGCAPGEAKPTPAAVPADVEVRGEPNCDMCLLKDGKGRIEEEHGNGCSIYVCDTCGWIEDIIFYDEEDDLYPPEELLLRVNLIEAATFR